MSGHAKGAVLDSDDLLYQVLKLHPDLRHEWLTAQCLDAQNGEAVLNEVSSLLDAITQSPDFLDNTLTLPDDLHAPSDRRGMMVGAFEIDSAIAQGGIGAVYKAHRVDGAYEQEVAIKIVPANDINTALFQSERQILADLAHPAITTILDGGYIQNSNDLYLAMEYIEGVDIIQYANDQNLNKAQRLNLFLNLLEVVQIAHQKGVIHCDLKPDNILVTIKGQIKLLDFGIAVAEKREADSVTKLPKFRGLTLAFSSPQRCRGELPNVGDDIYSLGIIFGLLMTRPSKDSPVKEYDLKQLPAILSNESLAIFQKASHEHAYLRYSSVAAFAEEIRNWLVYRPVQAYDGGVLYRIRKALRRHQGAWIGAVLFIGLLSLTGILSWQKAESNKTKALNLAQINAAVKLSKSVVRDLDDKLLLLEGSTLARLLSVETAVEQLEEIHQSQAKNAEVTRALIDTHWRIGAILSNPFKLHLGQFNQGREHVRRAYLLAKEAYVKTPNNKTFASMLRIEKQVTAQLFFVEGKQAEALLLNTQRLAQMKKLKNISLKLQSQVGSHYFRVSRLLVYMDKIKEAEFGYEKAKTLLPEFKDLGSEYENERLRRKQIILQVDLALFNLIKGHYSDAEQSLTSVVQTLKNSHQWADRQFVLQSEHGLACIALLEKNNVSTAQDHFKRIKKLADELVKSYPAAKSPRWQVIKYAQMASRLEASAASQGALTVWIKALSCDDIKQIYTPPEPENGWDEIRQNLTFSFLDLIDIDPDAL
ncbi:MAG: serine/threonine-protein kinase [Arenicellales bacterium]